MSETKTTCRHCERPPGGVHRAKCALGKRYAKLDSERKPPAKLSYGYPIANIFDCVGGSLKPKPIPRGTRHRVGIVH